jgi:rubredoxin
MSEEICFTLETGKLHTAYTIPMILTCPQCGERHIDEGVFETVAHHTHACQGCGFVWRPAKVNTHGVQFLPGYRNPQ